MSALDVIGPLELSRDACLSMKDATAQDVERLMLRRWLVAGTVSTLAITTAGAALAADWPEAATCSAGLQAYFFLDEPPSHSIIESDGYQRFTSKSGYEYRCRVDGPQIIFLWESNGQDKFSTSTRFSFDGDTLHVVTDMGERTFSRKGDVAVSVD